MKGVNGNKIDITLTKLDVGLSWKTLGRGLRGHNQLHNEKARGEYVVLAGCDCKQLHKEKARGEYVVFAGCDCKLLLSDMKENLKYILRYFLQLNSAIV